MARPVKLTPEIAKTIVERLEAGALQADAAADAGIDETTLSRWITRGERATSGPFRELRDAVAGVVEKDREKRKAMMRLWRMPASVAGHGRRGRPSRLTADLIARIVKRIVEDGDTDHAAAAKEGIESKSFKRWHRRGQRDANGLRRDLCVAVRKAFAARKARPLAPGEVPTVSDRWIGRGR